MFIMSLNHCSSSYYSPTLLFNTSLSYWNIDPGVGKTAVAEAIAQVLAVPLAEMEEEKKLKNKLPKIKIPKNPFRNKEAAEANGATTPTPEELMGYELPSCPASLVGARMINVELANLVAGTANRGDYFKCVGGGRIDLGFPDQDVQLREENADEITIFEYRFRSLRLNDFKHYKTYPVIRFPKKLPWDTYIDQRVW